MRLVQDHHFKFGTSSFLFLCLIVSALLKGLNPIYSLIVHLSCQNFSIGQETHLNVREQKDGGYIVFYTTLCFAVDAIVGITLKCWMEQHFLHILFIVINIGRNNI